MIYWLSPPIEECDAIDQKALIENGQETLQIILFEETSPESDLAKLNSALKSQLANLLNLSTEELLDWRLDFGAFYNNKTFFSQQFVQISFNLSSASIACKQQYLSGIKNSSGDGKLQLFDSNGLQLNVPVQDLRGGIQCTKSEGPKDLTGPCDCIEAKSATIAHYSVATDQVCEFTGSYHSIVCSSQVQYCLDQVIPFFSIYLNRSYEILVTNRTINREPCFSPTLAVYLFPILALNDFETMKITVPPKAIADQINKFLNNTDVFIVDALIFDKLPITATYKKSTIPIIDGTLIKLQVQSVVRSVGDSPIEPQLVIKGWPPFAINNTKVIIPEQDCKQTLITAIVVETFSFRLSITNKRNSPVVPGQLSFIEQLSHVLDVPATCFQVPQYKIIHKNHNVGQKFRSLMDYYLQVNISSMCGHDIIDIGRANATFWQLLNAGQLTLKGVNGQYYLALSIRKVDHVTIQFFIITKLQLNSSACWSL